MKLKLDYKHTFYIGLAFFAILMLWQVYNTYCPLILNDLLENKFNNADRLTYVIGIIMALDNLAALILMPIFGNLSDKTKTKYGKRMPYIIIGMFASLITFPMISVFYIYNNLIGVVIFMGLFLTIMQCYRSPAVALMPDITPKPLRSSANGIINLVGYIGAILGGVLAMIFKKHEGDVFSLTYLWPFLISSICMLFAMIFLAIKIKEPKLLQQNKEAIELGEKFSQSVDEIKENSKLTKNNFINLLVILFAVFFWFMSFNAIETFNSLFCQKILGTSSIHGTFTILLTVSSLISFIIFPPLCNKIGRKWSIVIGILLLVFGFGFIAVACFTMKINFVRIIIYFNTVIIGIGWALININSYPMIVEMSSADNIGKFTGYYYTASMIAQTITPILIGLIMSFNSIGLKLLYVYAAIMMLIALIIFLFSKEKRNVKVTEKKTLLEKIGDIED